MNDNQEITDLGIRALAAFIHEHRPDFDGPGVVAALRAERDTDVWQLAQRMIRRAANLSNTTPRLQPFDTTDLLGCRKHVSAAIRTDGTCGACFADKLEGPDLPLRDRGGKPAPPELRERFATPHPSEPRQVDVEHRERLAAARAELHPEAADA